MRRFRVLVCELVVCLVLAAGTPAIAGTIKGTITDKATGAGLGGVLVSVYNSAGVFVAVGQSANGTGAYEVTNLPSGSYYSRTAVPIGVFYADVAYKNLPCVLCDPTLGQAIVVTDNGTTAGIDYALVPGGQISGSVFHRSESVSGANVQVFRPDGLLQTYQFTAPNGTYTQAALPPGQYYIRTAVGDGLNFLDEAYPNVQCVPCPVQTGTPVTVVAGQTTVGIDFDLDVGGIVTGTVYDPILERPDVCCLPPGQNLVNVELYTSTGELVKTTYSGRPSALSFFEGQFAIYGLPSGSYRIRAMVRNDIFYNVLALTGYVSQLYTGTPFNQPCFPGCDVRAGAAIEVVVGSTTANVNFPLARGGKISGRVTNEVAAEGLNLIPVRVYSSTGVQVGEISSGLVATGAIFPGDFGLIGLPTGTYYIRTAVDPTHNYLDELFEGMPCFPSCIATSGTPISVTANAETTGMNLSLGLGGSISGTVTDASTGAGLSRVNVIVYTSAGIAAKTVRPTADGSYELRGLKTGSYYVRTQSFPDENYVNKLYVANGAGGVNCFPTCTVTAGTPISVTEGSTSNGINLALNAGGKIAGTVTDAVTGLPVAGVNVELYTSTGTFIRSVPATGSYEYIGLPTGSYFARAMVTSTKYFDELYNNLPCVSCSPTSGTPISVTAGATTGGIGFSLAPSGTITGTITSASAPLSDVCVGIYSSAGSFLQSVCASATGVYTSSRLAPGSYRARTFVSVGQNYLDELYNHLPCTPTCTITTGTPIVVTAGAATSNINFALSPGGTITGTVAEAVSGLPVAAGVNVELYTSTGTLVKIVPATGSYEFIGLQTGSYFARAMATGTNYFDELYNNLPCASCTPTSGTPISVTAGATTSGIAFSLAPSGAITGTITNSATGAPLSGICVQIYSSAGSFLQATCTSAAGVYTSIRLAPGSYRVRTSVSIGQNYLDELYNHLPCTPTCTVTAGTPIVVATGPATANINFALTPGGTITGTVTNILTGTPLSGVLVKVSSSVGSSVRTATTSSLGTYTIVGLPAGSYYASTQSPADSFGQKDYLDEPSGAPIAVTAGNATSGVNFALSPGATIAGIVTDAVSGAGLSNVYVAIGTSSGSFVGSRPTGAGGTYSVRGLAPGSYYAVARPQTNHLDELFNNLPCDPACSIGTGTPIAVTVGATVSGINFALSPGGSIAGTVTNAVTLLGIDSVEVAVYNAVGVQVDSAYSVGGTGAFTVTGLASGTYYARTFAWSNGENYVDKLYANTACLECPVTTGTPIVVTAGLTTSGVAFALSPGGSITGTVSDASSSAGLESVVVQVYNSAGVPVSSGESEAGTGFFAVGGLPSGSYYARTFAQDAGNYVDKLFANSACTNCNVTAGTPIAVTTGVATAGINFALAAGGRITGSVSDAGTSAGMSNVGVEVYDSLGTFVSSRYTSNTGTFAVEGLASGTYFARTAVFATYVNEAYGDLPCVPCNVTRGTAIVVTSGATRSGVDFALSPGGSLGGRVTDAGTATPLAWVPVTVYNSIGAIAWNANTDDAGLFVATGLPAGTYFVRAKPGSRQNYVPQFYAAHSDVGGLPTDGTPVVVTVGTTRTGVDFALSAGGSLSGKVTDAATGIGLSEVGISVYTAAGRVVKFGFTDDAGGFSVAGLPPGTYYASTGSVAPDSLGTDSSNANRFVDELYDDHPCLGCVSAIDLGNDEVAPSLPLVTLPCAPSCAQTVATGAPIVVTNGTTRTGVDFALSLGAGAISGAVSDALTGFRLSEDVQIVVYNASGTLVRSEMTFWTNGDGSGVSPHGNGVFTITGLAPGTYYARTIVSRSAHHYMDMAYGGVACVPCDVTTTPPIIVTTGAVTSGVDFALSPGGSIAGSVIDAVSSDPIDAVGVQLFTAGGALVKTTLSSGTGSFSLDGLSAGTYYARTMVPAGSVYVDELYENLSCASPCVVTAGLGIVVTNGATRNGTTFALSASVPAAVTSAATNVTTTSATLNGTVNPNGSSTTASFQYGLTTAYGSQVPASPAPGSGLSAVSVSGAIGGLGCGSLYHFRVSATNVGGTADGSDATVTTAACVPPTVTTGVATGMTPSSATLNGTVNPNGTSATVFFDYGTYPVYGNTVMSLPGPGSGTSPVAVSAVVSGLACGSLYHFRAVALYAGGGTSFGLDRTFITAACPPTIARIPNMLTQIGTPVLVPLTLGGGSRGPDAFIVTANSSNQELVSDGNLAVSGAGASRTLTITPVANQKGIAVITISVTNPATASDPAAGVDAGAESAPVSTTFTLQVGRPAPGDVDGDGKSDVTVFRPSTGIWYLRNIITGSYEFYQWGLNGDIPVTGDYDSDGKADVAVYRTTTGIWYIRNSRDLTLAFLQWGLPGDIPMPGDYDGDGKADSAVFRPSTGIWYVRDLVTNTANFYQWGQAGDIPVAADYDGDGATDVAVYRPSTGIWYIRNSHDGSTAFLQWGLPGSGDIPVPGDYDGDGKADSAVFRPSTGIWYVRDLVTNTASFYQWGIDGDVPVPGDFDGDGNTDIAMFRPSTSIWYVRPSSAPLAPGFYQWGTTGDIPILKRPE